MQVLMRKEDIRDFLGISLATVNNWIKTSVIPSPDQGDKYSEESFHKVVSTIKSGSIKLNGRANRSQVDGKYITFLGIKDKDRKQLLLEVIDKYENSELSIHEGVIALSISILKSNNLFSEGSVIYKKIIDWISQLNSSIEKLNLHFDYNIANLDDDFIGAFYQSIQSISERSNSGSYYTPSDLLKTIKIETNKNVIDPCCGSGGILLRILDKKHDPMLVFARDIDKIALHICEVNLVMFFNNENIKPNICCQDFIFQENTVLLFNQTKEYYDYIVTNPPWGCKFSKNQKDTLVNTYPEIQTTEAFSIALYNAIKMLGKKGQIFFFLPHSLLNVATHKNIRKVILQSQAKIRIKLLGNAFKGVLSEAILVSVSNGFTEQEARIIDIEDKNNNSYSFNKNQILAPDYIITATSSNIDDIILNQIFSVEHSTLLNNADFALGIVTGNNKEHILSQNTSKSEPIFRGKDIVSYKYSEPECFIEFNPEKYQQVAPIKYYRTKKIVYRFISDKIICALDDSNRLVLNSANLFISNKYPMETIVCLFNSCIYSYIYRKKFHSTKVLKSHLQVLPLPDLSTEQHEKYYSYYQNIYNNKISQQEIDLDLIAIFNLTLEQYNYIKDCTNGNS